LEAVHMLKSQPDFPWFPWTFHRMFSGVRKVYKTSRLLRIASLLAAIPLVVILCGMIYISYNRKNLPDLDAFLRFEPPTTGHIYDANGQTLIEVGKERREIIQYKDIPEVLRDAILSAEDENFFSFNGSFDVAVRPDVVSGQPFYLFGPQYPGGKAFNPAAFTSPPVDPSTFNPLRQGNLGRNALRGFGATQWDLGVHRDFPIHESLKLQFRAEMFNVLNHPNFGPPTNYFYSGSSGFGVSTQMLNQSLNNGNLGGGAFSSLYQIGGPRSIQLALKLMF